MENLFLRVLNMSISAAAVIAVVALVRLLLRSAPKKWRYLLWSAAGFRLCCPVSFQAVFSLFRLRPSSMAAIGGGESVMILPQSTPAAVQIGSPAVSLPSAVAAPITPAAFSAVVPAASVPVPEPVRLWPTLGIVLWLCGLAIMLTLGIVRYIRMKRLLTDAAALEKGVFATDRIRVPFILGLLPPRVFVPAGLGEEERTYVLAHERVHIRRGDHWVKLLAYLLLAVHWFNPAVWAAFFLLSRDMEMSCDERVLQELGGPAKAYSRTLLRFAEGRQFPAPAPLGFGESDARSRIKNALRWKKPKLWITLAAIVLCIAAVAACTADPKEPKETDMPETTGDTICFARTDETITLRGTEGSRSFGEILDELALSGFTYSEEKNVLRPDKRLLPGQNQLTLGMAKASVLRELYASNPVGTEDALFLAENNPGIMVENGEGGSLRLSGVFAGEPFGMTFGYAGTYADLLQRVVLTFWPPEDGNGVYPRAEDGKAAYARVKAALVRQLGEPDGSSELSADWNFQNGALSVVLGEKDDYSSVYILLTGMVTAESPWSWTSNLKSSDIREAVLRSASGPTEFLLNWEQIRELTALLKAVPKEQIKGGRGIPSLRVLELRDTGYALRFAGGVIELDCEIPVASSYSAAPVWEIHDEALYAWLDALWEGSPFGRAEDPLGLTLRVEDVTPMGCTLVFTQSGGSVTGDLMTEEQFRLFKQDADGSWKELLNANLLGSALYIAPDNSTAHETYWGGAFTLETGRYRIKKKVLDFRGTGDFDEYSIYAEFEITGGQTEALLGLTLRVKDVTPTGCTLVFTQSGGNATGELMTGEEFRLFKRDADGGWKDLFAGKDVSWIGSGSTIAAGGTTELETSWGSAFTLEAGRYRIEKEVLDFRGTGDFDEYPIYAEFVIPSEQAEDILGLTLRAEDVTPTGCTLVFTQSGGVEANELVTGAAYKLYDQASDGTWKELPTKVEPIWYLIGYRINPGSTTQLEAYWEVLYGPLPDGHYRISKEVTVRHDSGENDVYLIFAEFDLSVGAGETLPDDGSAAPLDLEAGKFDISAETLGTAAKGTIEFYARDQDTLGIRILADLTIGPEDWGGVAFYLPAGCRLDQVTCTYPETDGAASSDPPVNVWSTASENDKYTTMVEIGRDRSRTPSGGGVGTVVIEASRPWDSVTSAGSLTFAVECGAEEKDGYAVMGVSHSEIVLFDFDSSAQNTTF